MSKDIEWVGVKDRFDKKKIGAVCFVDDEVVAVVAFYDSKDANKDGEVSWGEWMAGSILPIGGTGPLEVVARAREQATARLSNPDGSASQARVTSLSNMFAKDFTQVAVEMALDGIFKTYIAPGIALTGGAVAEHIGAGMIKGFAIKKGMEVTAKTAYDAAVK